MKKFLLIALAFVPLLSMAQDDMYFTPKKKATKTDATKVYGNRTDVSRTSAEGATDKVVPVVYNNNSRSDDEYNRRYDYNNGSNGGDWQTGGGKDVADSLAVRSDSIRSGYSRDMEDDEDNYYYSRRLLRFHTPGYIAYRNPFYWDLVYGYGCYDYLDYWYGDPFYWHYGWGYGWSWGPWSCWYGPMWGWHSPYAWDYWGWGWHGPGYWGGGIAHHSYSRPRTQGVNYYDRRSFGNRTSVLGGGRNTRTSALASRGSRTSSSSYAGTRGSRIGARGLSDYTSRGGSRVGSYGVSTSTRSSSRGSYESNYGRSSANRSMTSRGSYESNSSTSRVRTPQTTSRSSANSSYSNRSTSTSSSSRSVGSYSSGSSGSFGGGSRSGGSFGGGSRGGGSFGGGGSRGGGGRR